MSYIVHPQQREFVYRMTATTPISHHDPNQASKGNITTYLRQKQLVKRDSTQSVDVSVLQDIANHYEIPDNLYQALSSLTAQEFFATALIYDFLMASNNQGLLEGVNRYAILQSRVVSCATSSASMFAFWGMLSAQLQIETPNTTRSSVIAMMGMPPVFARQVLDVLIKQPASAIQLARMWTQQKGYQGRTVQIEPTISNQSEYLSVDIPTFSANSIRHEMVRETGALHLLQTLGLVYDDLSPEVASLLYNGGDLSQSAPSNAFTLTRQIRESYPLLGLLGGSTKGFMLGASNLEVGAWLVCKENNLALARFGVASDISALDMLDYQQHQRLTAGRIDNSPMPFSFETLVTGVQLIVNFRLRPYATQNEVGVLCAALDTFANTDNTLGGNSAKGYGVMQSEILASPDLDLQSCRDGYEAHLVNNRETLRKGLLDRSLATSSLVL